MGFSSLTDRAKIDSGPRSTTTFELPVVLPITLLSTAIYCLLASWLRPWKPPFHTGYGQADKHVRVHGHGRGWGPALWRRPGLGPRPGGPKGPETGGTNGSARRQGGDRHRRGTRCRSGRGPAVRQGRGQGRGQRP